VISHLTEVSRPPEKLTDPVMLMGFAVRRRAGRHPQTVLNHLVSAWDAQLIARIEAEPFMDLTVRRPDIRIDEGVKPELDWPETRIYHAGPEGAQRDVFLLIAFEPHFYWRTYSQTVSNYALRLGIKTLVTLRSFPGSVPHTRPAPVTVTSSDAEIEAVLGVRAAGIRYEGPTDMSGVIAAELQAAGCETADLLVLQPYYFPRGPNPRVTIALIEPIDRLLGTRTDISELEKLVAVQTEEITEGFASDTDGLSALHDLEDSYDRGVTPELTADEDDGQGAIPDSQDVIDEVERFLQNRERGSEGFE